MRALISPLENFRIIEIKQVEFQVAHPLFWIGCPIEADLSWKYTEELGIHKPKIIIPEISLATLKLNKKSEIESNFIEDSLSSVNVFGLDWVGGFDSAIKLDAAMRLSQASGQTSVVFFDTNNVAHTLTFQQALQVILQVAGTYQFKLAKKNSKLNLINSATTASEVGAISW